MSTEAEIDVEFFHLIRNERYEEAMHYLAELDAIDVIQAAPRCLTVFKSMLACFLSDEWCERLLRYVRKSESTGIWYVPLRAMSNVQLVGACCLISTTISQLNLSMRDQPERFRQGYSSHCNDRIWEWDFRSLKFRLEQILQQRQAVDECGRCSFCADEEVNNRDGRVCLSTGLLCPRSGAGREAIAVKYRSLNQESVYVSAY